MLKAILNKGGAGKSIGRAETAERLSRLMEHQSRLMYAYDAAIRNARAPELAAGLEMLNKTTRADVGKFSELILSSGFAPPFEFDHDVAALDADSNDGARGRYLLEREREFIDALDAELETKHMIRTIATLENARANTRNRIETIQRMGEKLRLGIR